MFYATVNRCWWGQSFHSLYFHLGFVVPLDDLEKYKQLSSPAWVVTDLGREVLERQSGCECRSDSGEVWPKYVWLMKVNGNSLRQKTTHSPWRSKLNSGQRLRTTMRCIQTPMVAVPWRGHARRRRLKGAWIFLFLSSWTSHFLLLQWPKSNSGK